MAYRFVSINLFDLKDRKPPRLGEKRDGPLSARR